MDGRNFDDLTRALAARSSRRGVLRSGLALAGVALGLGGLREADAAGRRRLGQICRADTDCASGRCGPPDSKRRRRCLCASAADCPRPGGTCAAAVCAPDGTCGVGVAIGATCDTGNRCLVDGICNAKGQCQGRPVQCGALDDCHDVGVCNPATGICSNPSKPDGALCQDGDPRTCSTCQGGVCTGTVVDLQTDANNCGACFSSCPPGQTCAAGTCA